MAPEPLLPPESLARCADAIVRASLGIEKGDTLVVQGEPEHRELLVALAESAYRGGARFVDVVTNDPLVLRARLLHGNDDALGAVSPWARRRLREASGPHGALAHLAGEGEAGYLDGIPPKRIATDYSRRAKQLDFLRRAQLNMRARWIIAGCRPTTGPARCTPSSSCSRRSGGSRPTCFGSAGSPRRTG